MIHKFFVSKAYNNETFEAYVNETNMNRARIFTKVIILLEFIMVILTFSSPDIFNQESLATYRLHFISLLSYAILFYLLTLAYGKQIIKHSKWFKIIIDFTVLFGMLWGASITMMDLEAGGTMSVYLTFLFIMSIVIVIRPDFSLLIIAVVQTYFVVNLPEHTRIIEIVLNSTVFAMFAWFVARQQYDMIYNNYIKNRIIEEKNEMLEHQNLALGHISSMDHLTHLYNRFSLNDILSKKWVEAMVHQNKISVLMIDIDSFKNFNDTYGHVKGDECIIEVAKLLLDVAQIHHGYAFRYGGDEFCMIFTDIMNLDIVLDEIHQKMTELGIIIDNTKVKVSLSIGAYETTPTDLDGEWTCIDAADKALYHIKAQRKRRIND